MAIANGNENATWLNKLKKSKKNSGKALVVFAIGTVSVVASALVVDHLKNEWNNNSNTNLVSSASSPAALDTFDSSSSLSPLAEFLGAESALHRELEEEGDLEANKNETHPGIVWLFAYPQSGAYHLCHILQTVSQRACGTNKGNMYMNPKGVVVGAPRSRNSMRVYGNRGPPLLSGHDLSPPDHNIIVHTDPVGSGDNIHPKDYMLNTKEFRDSLWTASVVKDGDYHKVLYSTNDVVSGLHLYRYPFDNIVLRYWALREQKDVSNHNGWVRKYGAANDGFLEWCNTLDDHWYETELAWYGEDVMKLTENVPCHQEFYKYINYYNNVDMIERGAGLPMKRICYDEFYNHYHNTVGDLIKTYDLPTVRPAPEEGGGADLIVGFSQHYFTREQKDATYKFMKAIALPHVREMMEMFEENDFTYRYDP